MADIYDLLIIGGGIHGAGIARDAAGRGGWETAGIIPEMPAPVTDGQVWVVLLIHTAPPGGDPPLIAGTIND
jgi:glycine/D-amino acid oxidase-like deaminating enzyme